MTPTTRAAALGLAATLALAAPAADAATFRFSYAADEGLLLGTLQGTLKPDGNTVIVTAMPSLSFGGVAMGPMTRLGSFSAFSLEPTVTLDGSFMNLEARGNFVFPPVGSPNAQDTLVMKNDVLSSKFVVEIEFAKASDSTFEPDRWSMAVVPLPATLGLLFAAVAGLSALRRRAA